MSSIYIITIIIGLLICLVCYIFVSQTIEKKQKQKQRLLTALKARSRTFKYILNGFPPDFLPKQLSLLVHRSLIDVCEQLSKMEPEDSIHIEELQHFSQQMDALQRKESSTKRVQLKNAQQVQEVRRYLQELNKFIYILQRRGTITGAQVQGYSALIKQLVLQISVDNYLLSGSQAKQAGKTRLAVHYYGLAKKLLVREGGNKAFQQQIIQLDAILEEQEALLAETDPQAAAAAAKAKPQEPSSTPVDNEAASEWEEFDKEEHWQKKKIYD